MSLMQLRTQLTEISAKKVDKYIDRAETDAHHREHKLPQTDQEHIDWKRKQKARGKGLNNAWDKVSGKAKVNATEEVALTEGGTWNTHHDDEFEKHLGFSKVHTWYNAGKQEFTHLYRPGRKMLKPRGEKGEKTDVIATGRAMMKYHGYELANSKNHARETYTRETKDRHHEVHFDKRGNHEPEMIWHKETFKG